MNKNYKILEVSVVVFKVLSWASLAIGVVASIIIFVGGGTPEAPRATGLLGLLLGVVYFFLFIVSAEIIKLLLEVRSKLDKSA